MTEKTTQKSTMPAATAATFIGLGIGFMVGLFLPEGVMGLERWALLAIGAVVGGLVGWVVGRVITR